MKTKPTQAAKPAKPETHKYMTGYYPNDVATLIETLAAVRERSTNYVLNKLVVYALKNVDKAMK